MIVANYNEWYFSVIEIFNLKQKAIACSRYTLVGEDEIWVIFRAQAEDDAVPLQSWLKRRCWGELEVSPRCLVLVVKWSPGLCIPSCHGRGNILWVWRHKEPSGFCSFLCWYWDFILQDLLSPGTSDTLQIPTDIYSLPHRPWEMNSSSLEENPNLAISSAHHVNIFLPLPLPVIVTSTGSHHLRCDKSMVTSSGGHLSTAPIPSALRIS